MKNIIKIPPHEMPKLSNEIRSALMEMDQRFMDFPWNVQNWKDFFEQTNNSIIYLIDENEVLAAFVVGTLGGNEAFDLLKILVHPQYRRKGMGQRLLEQLVMWLGSQGVVWVNLEVRTSNFEAIKFYQKNNFSTLHEQAGYYSTGEGALRMQKRLGIEKTS